MSETAVEKVTPQNLADKLKERVRNMLFDELPDTDIEKMITSEYHAFFESKCMVRYNVNSRNVDPGDKITRFEYMIEEIMRDLLKDKISNFLNSLVHSSSQGLDLDNELWGLAKDVAEKVTPSVMKGLAIGLTENIIRNMQSGTYNSGSNW